MAERTDCDDVPAVLPSRSPRYENQSIERAFGILEAISDAPKALTLAEIVNRTGLDRATAYRLLAVLVRLRLLHKDAAAARYSLGFGIFKLGRHGHALASITRHARPFLRMLAHETNAVAHLAALEGSQTVCYERIDPGTGLKIDTRVGMYVDAHACALGKALLAYRSTRAVEQLYQSVPLRASTSRTVTSLRTLLGELAEIRARGWAEDRDELQVGLSCVAAPVVNPIGLANVAVSVSFLTEQPPAPIGELRARVAEIAQRIAHHIVDRDDD